MQPADMVAFISFMLMLGVVLTTMIRSLSFSTRRKEATRAQMEMFKSLADKLGNSQDLLAWLQTEAGQSLLKAPAEPAAAHSAAPANRILNAIQAGLIVVAVAIGCLLVNSMFPPHDRDASMTLFYFGGIGLTAGLGLLASAGASWWVSRKLGLIRDSHNS